MAHGFSHQSELTEEMAATQGGLRSLDGTEASRVGKSPERSRHGLCKGKLLLFPSPLCSLGSGLHVSIPDHLSRALAPLTSGPLLAFPAKAFHARVCAGTEARRGGVEASAGWQNNPCHPSGLPQVV